MPSSKPVENKIAPPEPAPAGFTPLSITFVMEQVLGHRTYYHNLRRAAEATPGLKTIWTEITYQPPRQGWPPFVPSRLAGWLVGQGQTGRGLWQGRQNEVVFFHTQKPAALYGQLPRRRPWVLSLDVTPRQYDRMGNLYDDPPGDLDSPAARLKYRLNRHLFQRAALIVAWSEWVKHSLVEDYGVEPAKIEVIPPGVDLSLWADPLLPDASAPAALPKILFVGGDWERKGGPLLLDWFYREGRGRCELHLVTRRTFSPEELEQAGPGVFVYNHFTSNNPALIDLYRQSDLFVLPTRAECFGIALTEAMAMGLPVVTTRVAAAAEIVLEGQTGFLIEPEDSAALAAVLDRLLANPALRQNLGHSARHRATQDYDAFKNARYLFEKIAGIRG